MHDLQNLTYWLSICAIYAGEKKKYCYDIKGLLGFYAKGERNMLG